MLKSISKLPIWLKIVVVLFLWPFIIYGYIWTSKNTIKIKAVLTAAFTGFLLVVSAFGPKLDVKQSLANNSTSSSLSSSESQSVSSSQSSAQEFIEVSSKTPIDDAGLAAQEIAPALPKVGGNQKLYDVLEVVDGDTIKISELGTLRLIGMDTPETKDPRKPVQCFGAEASNNAKNQLAGKKVYLEYDPANRVDKYNRTLAYVFREDGYFYNRQAISDGFAFSYKSFNHPKLVEFNQIEQQAKSSQAGLWNPSTCNGVASPVVVKSSAPAPVVVQPSPTTQPTQQTESVYYANCTEVRAAGKDPIYRDQPGYRSKLDGDGDGIACDK